MSGLRASVAYRVADDDHVIDALQAVLAREPIVESQHRLAQLVRAQLQQTGEHEVRVSEQRVRKLAVEEGIVQVRVRTGTTHEPAREACPVCGQELDRVANRTLTGGETVVGTRCSRCPYRSGHQHEVPLRYEFVRAGEPPVTEKGPF